MNGTSTCVICVLIFMMVHGVPCQGLALSDDQSFITAVPGIELQLPPQVPYLNPLRSNQTQYCVGNGVVAAVADPGGKWNLLVGPGYGAKDIDPGETFQFMIDGQPMAVSIEMRRARQTGIFYGTGTAGDIRYFVIDHARFGDPCLSRLVLIENISSTRKHGVCVQAHLQKAEAALKDANGVPRGYGSHGIAIAFTDPAATASNDGNVLTSPEVMLAPGEAHPFGLIHLAEAGEDAASLAKIHAMDDVKLARQSIDAWRHWYGAVPPAYSLDRITDPRARDLVEGGLAVLKENQSADGGFMATPIMYRASFVRDCVMGLRGLEQAGHFKEAGEWIKWFDLKFKEQRACDFWTLEPQLQPDPPGIPVGSPSDFEITSLYVLTARDYYHATGDLQALRQANNSIQYCIDAQLKSAEENNDHFFFNGDETEICFAVPAEKTGIGTRGGGCTSMSSAALFCGALEFYMEYLKAIGGDPSAYVNSLTKKTVDLHRELGRIQDAIEAAYWRTDVPGLSGGFHDSFRVTGNGAWPKYPIVNFTLQPIYWNCPYKISDRRKSDVDAMKSFYNPKTGFIQLFPGVDNGFCGHNLGYLLYDLVEVKDPMAAEVYQALTQGPTPSWEGYWNEAYTADGTPSTDYAKGFDNGLRTMETGVNISAIGHYWRLGESDPAPSPSY